MSTTSNSSSTALRKQQEELNAKVIRELATIPANKFCFECGQRGPTWVNVSESSFCCMHCAGLLRGLNPPHKVKSISMSTFTQDEVEKLRRLGNEENARIWLGLYDGQVKFQPRVDDDVKQHLIQKYENKKWYVSPTELAQQRKLLEEHSRRDSSSALSVHSQQSIQSSPANLYPNVQKNNDLLDLLSNDLFSTPTPSTAALSSSCIPSSLNSVTVTQPTSAMLNNPNIVPNWNAYTGLSSSIGAQSGVKRDAFSLNQISIQPNNQPVKPNQSSQLNNDLLDLLSSDFFSTPTPTLSSSGNTIGMQNNSTAKHEPSINTGNFQANGASYGVKRDAFSMNAINTQPDNPFVPMSNYTMSSQPNNTMTNLNNWNPFAS